MKAVAKVLIHSLVVSVAISLATVSAQASNVHDLGVHGEVWEIGEIDIRIAIMRDLANADVESMQEELTAQARDFTKNLPAWDLPVAHENRHRLIDPSITIDEDIYAFLPDENGEYQWSVVFEEGTRVNPLNYTRPPTWMLAFDGESPAQVALAEEILKKTYGLVIPIATAGDPSELARSFDQPVYYFQDWMFSRFRIERTVSLFGVDPNHPEDLSVIEVAYPFDPELIIRYLYEIF